VALNQLVTICPLVTKVVDGDEGHPAAVAVLRLHHQPLQPREVHGTVGGWWQGWSTGTRTLGWDAAAQATHAAAVIPVPEPA